MNVPEIRVILHCIPDIYSELFLLKEKLQKVKLFNDFDMPKERGSLPLFHYYLLCSPCNRSLLEIEKAHSELPQLRCINQSFTSTFEGTNTPGTTQPKFHSQGPRHKNRASVQKVIDLLVNLKRQRSAWYHRIYPL
jgi:hypothetical protein